MVRKDSHTAYIDLLVQKHLTGDISPAGEERLQAHLATCRACRREEAFLLKKKSLLAAARLPGLSDAFKPKLFAKLGLPLAERRPARAPYWLPAAAAVCLALSGIFALRFYQALYPADPAVTVEAGFRADPEAKLSLQYTLGFPPERDVTIEAYSDRPRPRPAKGKVKGKGFESPAPQPEHVTVIIDTGREDRPGIERRVDRFLALAHKSTRGPKFRILYRLKPETRADLLLAILLLELLLRIGLEFMNRGRIVPGWITRLFGSLGLPYYIYRAFSNRRGPPP